LNSKLFVSAATAEPFDIELASTEEDIPVQFRSLDEKEAIEQYSLAASALLQALFYGSLAVNLVAFTSLQFLWGLINALQLAIHIPILDINLPPNVLVFLQTLFNIINFDLFDTESNL